SVQPWGFAEVVTDAEGAHVMVHKVTNAGLEEYLVAFVATETPNVGGVGSTLFPADGTWSQEFIATP
ncbi:MAG TPA: hypothetical protein VKO38_00240, partial [Wenzhouxiangella sp.]|nr:hypothetical protein [Wenzhouxiangella sp.]